MKRISVKTINKLVNGINIKGEHTAKNITTRGDFKKCVSIDNNIYYFKSNKEMYLYLMYQVFEKNDHLYKIIKEVK